MMTFKLHLKRVKKLGHARIKFDLEKLNDPEVAEAFHAMIGRKFAVLTILDADGTDMDTLINTFNTAVTNTASEILGKHRPVKKPWLTADLLYLCDKQRELKKKKKKDTEGVRQNRAANQEIKKGMTKAKMNWIEEQNQDIEDSMKKNNSKKTYQLVKDLTSTKQGRTTIMQDKDGKCLTEEQDFIELYHYRATGDPAVLNVPPATDNDNYPILREEVEAVVKLLKKGMSAGADNVPAELVQAGGEAMIGALLTICNKIWQTGEWPTKLFNLRILCEKYLQHHQDLYHVFIDFKKAFDRVWHAALWATMRHFNINANLIKMITILYDKATSAVYLNNSIGDWFRTTVGVRQGCVFSPTLFNIYLERIMTDALNDHEGTVSIGGRSIINLRFADDIDGLAALTSGSTARN